ncbi:MAG: HlyC/CorC family transporter [Nitrospina sp.]|nr:HlyC/CorC family transporter [Nitrospina sp.]
MDLSTTLILIGVFILVEAFFSGSEIGMIAINRIKMKQQADEGNQSAQIVLNLLNSPEKLFATTSLGTNLSVVSSTSIFTAYMVTHMGKQGELLAMIILSPIILFGGEIVPKMILQNRADSIMPIFIRPLNMSLMILSPIINFFTSISNFITNKMIRLPQEDKKSFSRDQIIQVLSLDSQTIELDATERTMIHKIFNFGEITVEQCMVPLVQLIAIRDDSTLAEAHQLAVDTGFSRFPIFHERMHNIIGVLNTFDLLNESIDDSPLTHLIRPAHYIPSNKKIDDLLKELQKRGLHMGVVVDEYGGCIGLTTVEDLLEEIVGEIEDEYDKPEQKFQAYPGGGYIIDGEMEIDAINEIIRLNLPTGDYETLAGLILNRLETIPQTGEQITVEDVRLTVKETSRRKIQSIIAIKVTHENPATPPRID